jgi:AraC-like DNA-binding protein
MRESATVQESARFWRAPDLGDLELLRATYVTHSFAPHTHDGFAIGVIEDGAERFRYRRGDHAAPAGSLVLVNPGEPHTGSAALPSGWRYRMLYPAPELLQRAASQLSGRPRPVPFFPQPVAHDPALAAALLRLHATLEASADPLERESRLLATFAALVQRHADTLHLAAPAVPEPGAVRQVRAYLEDHAAEAVTLADLAALTGLSEFGVVRSFQRATGLPPHAYLTQLRVDRARRLLASGLAPAQAAPLAGFYDQSHLTRHFKRIVGVPPAQYARHAR